MIATAVLVHGAGGGGWQWRVWADVLRAAGMNVLAPDLLPGADGIENTAFADYRSQVAGWCRAAGAPVILIGASLGGLLALSVAGGQGVCALVLVNSMPPVGVRPWSALVERPAVVRWSASSLERTIAALPDADLASARWAHARWRDESGRAMNEAAAGIAVAAPACPVLVMASGRDDDIAPATSRAVANELAADFVSIPCATHLGVLLGHSAPAAAALAIAWLDSRAWPGNAD